MKKLINLAIASTFFEDGFNGSFNLVEAYLKRNALDGLEIILYGDYDVNSMKNQCIIGHHLLYWPNWLNLWHGNNDELIEEFHNSENIMNYYGFTDKQGMIDYLKKEFEIAKELEVDYMVFHVSHVTFEEIFTFEHKYDDMDVMKASIELINEVFEGEGPLLLFENLWWPGLTYRDTSKTKWFLEQVAYENKGYLLDVAHLLGTNSQLNNEDESIDFVHEVLDELGDTIKDIKGMHLNKTIAGPYLREDHNQRLQDYRNKPDFVSGFKNIHNHITAMDGHKPFDHPRIKEIIERINPAYLVFEFGAKDLEELEEMIQIQHSNLA